MEIEGQTYTLSNNAEQLMEQARELAVGYKVKLNPLHLLAVIIKDNSSSAGRAMREAGLYKEQVDEVLFTMEPDMPKATPTQSEARCMTAMLEAAVEVAHKHGDGRTDTVQVYDLALAALAVPDLRIRKFVVLVSSRFDESTTVEAVRNRLDNDRPLLGTHTAPLQIQRR